MTVKQLKRPQVVSQETIDAIREILDAAERGEVTGIVLCANIGASKEYFRTSDFSNAWEILGAIEYAKDSVLRALHQEAS